MLELILVRHGSTDDNQRGVYCGWKNTVLNEEGKMQAINMREKLLKDHFDYIYSSPLSRAVETANEINSERSLPIHIRHSLIEIHFGDWEGLSHQMIYEQYPQLWESWSKDWIHFRFPNGESAYDMHQRVKAEIACIINECKEGKVLIVTHQGCIRSIISQLLWGNMDGYWRCKIKTGGICRMEILEDYTILTALNE